MAGSGQFFFSRYWNIPKCANILENEINKLMRLKKNGGHLLSVSQNARSARRLTSVFLSLAKVKQRQQNIFESACCSENKIKGRTDNHLSEKQIASRAVNQPQGGTMRKKDVFTQHRQIFSMLVQIFLCARQRLERNLKSVLTYERADCLARIYK